MNVHKTLQLWETNCTFNTVSLHLNSEFLETLYLGLFAYDGGSKGALFLQATSFHSHPARQQIYHVSPIITIIFKSL